MLAHLYVVHHFVHVPALNMLAAEGDMLQHMKRHGGICDQLQSLQACLLIGAFCVCSFCK